MIDLAVLGPDPRFGGGSAAHPRALIDAAESLGLVTALLYVPHPALGDGRVPLSISRIEAIRMRAAQGRNQVERDGPGHNRHRLQQGARGGVEARGTGQDRIAHRRRQLLD